MSTNISSSEMRESLAQLERRLSAMAEQIKRARTPQHAQQLEDFRVKAGSFRQRLHATDETN